MNRLIIAVVFAFLILIADFLLKAYVHACVPPIHAAVTEFPFGGISVFQGWHGIDFALVHVWNKGAAWGWFSSFHRELLYLRFLMIGGLLSYIVFVRTTFFRKFCALAILTGAIGNVIDIFLYSHVVDMFFFSFWGHTYPVFNIADCAIFCGIALMLVEALVGKVARFKRT